MRTAVTRWKEKLNEGNNYNGDYLSHSSCDLLDKQGEDKMTSGYLALCLAFVLGWISHCLWIWAKDKKGEPK